MSTDVNKVSNRYNLFGVRLGITKQQAEEALVSNDWIPVLEIEGERLYMTESNPEISMIVTCNEQNQVIGVLYGDPYAAGLGEEPSEIRVRQPRTIMQVGEHMQLQVEFVPEGSYAKLFWTGGNPDVAWPLLISSRRTHSSTRL